jgi:hypothetical protein
MTSITVTDYTPQDLLDAARGLLDHPDARVNGVWPRAASHLARQALEQTIEDFWRARVPALADTPMRVQLTSLPTFLKSAETAARAAYTWACLSNACHHHAYELAPSTAELSTWMDHVKQVRNVIIETLKKNG